MLHYRFGYPSDAAAFKAAASQRVSLPANSTQQLRSPFGQTTPRVEGALRAPSLRSMTIWLLLFSTKSFLWYILLQIIVFPFELMKFFSFWDDTIISTLQSKGSLWSKVITLAVYIIVEMLFLALMVWFFLVVLRFLQDKNIWATAMTMAVKARNGCLTCGGGWTK